MVKLSYGDCWQQKRATCFATLLLNELNSVVARFTTHESNLSYKKSGCWKLQILTSDWIKLRGSNKAIHGSYVSYWNKKQVCLGPIKRATYRAANFRNLPTTWFVARHVCTWQVKHATSIASQLVLQQCWRNVARFCCTFYRTFNNRTKTATKCIAVKLLRTCGPARSFPLPTIPIKHLIAGYQTWETWFHDLIYQKIWRRRPYYHTVARVIFPSLFCSKPILESIIS